ncbi:MAG: valine--pyruvate transaminase [Candidatus Levybacteria bacterium]|nr:valine--pyruvate transaminase [Candidatus Levybacteria bacterium]
MELSQFGEKLTSKTGILQLMDDLGKAMSGKEKMYMLGGGNPAHITQMEELFRKRMQEILDNKDEFERMVGNYTTSQGDIDFIHAVVAFFKKTYGWNITTKNVCALTGGQTTFFFLFNMLAGKFSDGSSKKILFPLVPEYIGYADQGITDDIFTANKPIIKIIDEHTFKYFIDFESLKITKDIAAICVSRPTNPTGNVVTDEEVHKLLDLAKKHKIPLMIDNAYGAPFPGIIFTKTNPILDDNIIYVVSLSKLGLPSVRTSIVIAKEEIIKHLTSINAIVNLTATTIGQHIVTPLLQSGEITKLSQTVIKPFYQRKSNEAIAYLQKHMNQSNPYYIHKSEGALFLWLWLKDLPIKSMELYERLKKRKVLVVPGNYFYPGFRGKWKHRDECVRITYSQREEDVKAGLKIIAETINEAYNK